MEEKIIDGKFKNSITPIIVCVIAVFCIIIFASIEADAMNHSDYYYSSATIIDGLLRLFCFGAYSSEIYSVLLYLGVIVIIISLIIFFMTKSCSLTVSNTRVVGKASFGKRVDLPLNQVSAIGFGMLKSMT